MVAASRAGHPHQWLTRQSTGSFVSSLRLKQFSSSGPCLVALLSSFCTAKCGTTVGEAAGSQGLRRARDAREGVSRVPLSLGTTPTFDSIVLWRPYAMVASAPCWRTRSSSARKCPRASWTPSPVAAAQRALARLAITPIANSIPPSSSAGAAARRKSPTSSPST